MKGKVNWFHVLQIFLVGLVGAIIFLVIILPQNIGGIKKYINAKEQIEQSGERLQEKYDLTDANLGVWVNIIVNKPMNYYFVKDKDYRKDIGDFVTEDLLGDIILLGDLYEGMDYETFKEKNLCSVSDIVLNDKDFKTYIKSEKKVEENKQSVKAAWIAFLIPLSVTLLFCGIKAYEDIKS